MITAQSPAICASPTQRRRNRIGLFSWAFRALQAHRQRARLASLGPHLLADIGLSAEAAEAEAARPVWDVPSHWKR